MTCGVCVCRYFGKNIKSVLHDNIAVRVYVYTIYIDIGNRNKDEFQTHFRLSVCSNNKYNPIVIKYVYIYSGSHMGGRS